MHLAELEYRHEQMDKVRSEKGSVLALVCMLPELACC